MNILHKEVKLALLFVLLAACPLSQATVMGKAKVLSSIGEPLNIQIPVTDIDTAHNKELCFSLSKNLAAELNMKGQVTYDKLTNIISLKSTAPYKELMGNFGISESCSTDGVITKNYTVLLDLPSTSDGLIKQNEMLASQIVKKEADGALVHNKEMIEKPAPLKNVIKKKKYHSANKMRALSTEDSIQQEDTLADLMAKNKKLEAQVLASDLNVKKLENTMADLKSSLKDQDNLIKAKHALDNISGALESEKNSLNDVKKNEVVAEFIDQGQDNTKTNSTDVVAEDKIDAPVKIDDRTVAPVDEALPVAAVAPAPAPVVIKKPMVATDNPNPWLVYEEAVIGIILLVFITAIILIIKNKREKNKENDNEDDDSSEGSDRNFPENNGETNYLNDDEYDHNDREDAHHHSPRTAVKKELNDTDVNSLDETSLAHPLYSVEESVISFDMGDYDLKPQESLADDKVIETQGLSQQDVPVETSPLHEKAPYSEQDTTESSAENQDLAVKKELTLETLVERDMPVFIRNNADTTGKDSNLLEFTKS